MTEAALVGHLLANRYRVPNRAFINCLALARLNPSPRRRVTVEELMLLFGHSQRGGISHLMLELQRCGLVEFESGVRGAPGYMIWRVGPKEERPARNTPSHHHL
jgi:hypothetical protein